MNEYETEDQQVEAVKKWLKENLGSLVTGLGVGVLALGGWNYYVDQKNTHAFQAGALYMQAAQQMSISGVDETVIDLNNQLVNDFSDTPYAVLTALVIAKKEYDKGNVDETIAQLEWAGKHANSEELKQISVLRLSRVLIEQQRYDDAMSYLNQPHAAAFDAEYEELKGDVYAARGQLAEARTAYDKAIQQKGNAGKWLQLKRQNLGNQDKGTLATS